MWAFNIMAVPFFAAVGLGGSAELKPLPDCGVASVYAVAKQYHRANSLTEVEAALARASGGDKLKEFSLAELRSGVSALGLHGRSVMVTEESLERVTLPAILYVRPEQFDANSTVGHFMVLQEVRAGRVTVLDLTRSASAWDMTAEELFSFWDGECLEVSSIPFFAPIGWRWAALWSAVGCLSLGGMFRLWRLPVRSLVAMVASCLAFTICGCGKSEPVALLSFEQREYSAGVVRAGETVNLSCALTNTSSQNVVVKSINGSCECMTQDKSLEGQALEPGARRSFLVSMATLKRVREIGGSIEIATEPPSPVPIVVQVSAIVAEAPQIVQSLPIRVSSLVGERASVEFAVECYRGKASPTLSWCEQDAQLQGFETRRFDTGTQDYGSRGNMKRSAFRDLLQWTMLAPADLPIGEHAFELPLQLGMPDSEPLRVPVIVNVLHPIQPSLDRIFFGFVQIGKEKTIDLSLEKLSDGDFFRLQVTSDFPAVLAEKQDDAKVIRLRMSPSISAGRFMGNVSLSLPDTKWPELLIPFSGIVQSDK